MYLFPFALLFITQILADHDDNVLVAGNDFANTREFASSINKNNVARLALNWQADLCGPGTATPLVVDDSVYISDFGQCYQRFDRDTGAVIFKKNMTSDYGFPIGLFARGMPTFYQPPGTYQLTSAMAILGTTSVKTLLQPGFGAWLFATRLLTGDKLWQTTVSTFPWTIITQSPVIVDGVIYVGTSSSESSSPLQPGYVCCNFVGGMGAYRASDGVQLWWEPNAPPSISGVGKYSGMAVWGSTPVIVGEDIYYGSGQLYAVPSDVEACIDANPLNASCIHPEVMADAIIRRNRFTGALKGFKRLTAVDVWNIACFLRLPSCQTPLAAYDFDITSVQYSKQTNTLYAGSKSGYIWSFDRDLNIRWGRSEVAGSTAGGFVWQNALQDDCNLDDLNIYGVFTNAANLNWSTTPGGVNATGGGVVRYDGHGNLKAIARSPTGNQMYGAATVTNNIVFASDRNQGNMYALHSKTLATLWTFNASGLQLSSGPAVVGREVFWPAGATSFTSAPTPKKIFAFKLPRYHN